MSEQYFYTIQLDERTEKYLTLCLFSNVKNIPELIHQVKHKKLNCCLLKASLIVDPFQVTVAANKAALSEKFSKVITKTPFSEIMYNLSVSKNISQSLDNFCISEKDTEILVALLHSEDEREVQIETILKTIEGQRTCLSRLEKICDVEGVKKLYKIDDTELKISSLLDSVVSRISVKEFISIK